MPDGKDWLFLYANGSRGIARGNGHDRSDDPPFLSFYSRANWLVCERALDSRATHDYQKTIQSFYWMGQLAG